VGSHFLAVLSPFYNSPNPKNYGVILFVLTTMKVGSFVINGIRFKKIFGCRHVVEGF